MATTKDIARALDVDEQTVRRYAREGIIPFAETLGGHRRYDLDEVRAALARARSAAVGARRSLHRTDLPPVGGGRASTVAVGALTSTRDHPRDDRRGQGRVAAS